MGAIMIAIGILYFVIFGLAALCLGGAALSRIGLGRGSFQSARGKVGIEIALGIGLWGLIYFPLSAIEGFWITFGQPFFIVLMILIIARWHRHIEDLTELFSNWRKYRRASTQRKSFHSILSVLLIILLTVAFLNACGPSRGWDELVDHLPRARFIADNGALADDTSNPFSGYPALCELIFAPLTGLTSELCAVTVFMFAVALFLMLAGFARTFLPPGWANPTVIILFSMPLMADLMRSALVDLPLSCFCFAAFYLISIALTYQIGESPDSNNLETNIQRQLNQDRPQSGMIFTAGIFLGFAMSVKYTGLLVALSWVIMLTVTLLLKRLGIKRTVALLITFLLPALVVSGGWYLRNLLLYGNPVYPFLEGFFNREHNAAFDIYAFTRPEMHKSPLDILLYPIRLTFDYKLIRNWYSAITPAFLCFIPLGLIIGGRDKFRPIFNLTIWLGIINLCLAFFMSPGHTRYLLPLWAILAPSAAWGMARVSDGSRFLRRFLIPAVLIIPLCLMLAQEGKLFVELTPYFAGQESRDDVIAQEMPSHIVAKKMKGHIPPGGKLLSIEPRVYYMPEGTVIGTPGIEAPDSPRWDEENTAALAVDMQAKGFTNIFIDSSSRQIKHAMAMDFFLATIPAGVEGRYYCYEGIVEEMEKRYGISHFFTKEDLYSLSAIGGFDIYKDASGRDWHWVDKATIERRSKYSRNLRFIRHFWLLERYLLEQVDLDDTLENPAAESSGNVRNGGAVLYRVNYSNLRDLRRAQKRHSGGRLLGLNNNPQLTPEIQFPNEDELYLWKKQNAEGMI